VRRQWWSRIGEGRAPRRDRQTQEDGPHENSNGPARRHRTFWMQSTCLARRHVSCSTRAMRALVPAALFVALVAGCQTNTSAQPTTATPQTPQSSTATVAASPTPAISASPALAASPSAAPAASPPTSSAQVQQASAAGLESAIRDVANAVKPAVVQITNEQTQIGQFNQPFTVPAGVGSGLIYDNQGHILTNNHVVAGAQSLQVSLPDKRSFPAKLVGSDPQTDLAVVQISADSLPVASLAPSNQLQVGDWVVAIGDALALPGGPTVTQGVVSALGRTVQEPASSAGGGNGGAGGGPLGGGPLGGAGQAQQPGPFLFDVIQTDAPINPGNSGGPLVDLSGQVIGINTLVAGQAEPGVQAQGIGFAISIATAKPIADQLVSTGQVVHPFIGIQYVPLNPAIATQLRIPTSTQGVVIGAVQTGSPADQAGLQARDVITAVDGQPLASDTALAEAVNAHKPGDTLSFSVLRQGQQSTVQVTLGTLPTS
jgi:S1-C subfamily serine protease